MRIHLGDWWTRDRNGKTTAHRVGAALGRAASSTPPTVQTHRPKVPWEIREASCARLKLTAVDDGRGDDRDWIINAPLTFRKCLGCGAPVVDAPENRVATQWVPRRESVWRGRGRSLRLESTNPGPHPVGTPACADCRPLSVDETRHSSKHHRHKDR